jgi:hypothetical protein
MKHIFPDSHPRWWLAYTVFAYCTTRLKNGGYNGAKRGFAMVAPRSAVKGSLDPDDCFRLPKKLLPYWLERVWRRGRRPEVHHAARCSQRRVNGEYSGPTR